MTASELPVGNVGLRRRTRAAIVAAAAALVDQGKTPSVNDVAEAAQVSRRTVYQYFPTLDQLLIDATLGLLTQAAVDEAIDDADVSGDPRERVTAMVEALSRVSIDTLPLGRSLLRLTVAADNEPGQPRRGFRRAAWIERALVPLKPRLTEAGYQRLVSALAVVVGWEALIVLTDVRGLAPEEQTEVSLWAARALVEAALAESAAD